MDIPGQESNLTRGQWLIWSGQRLYPDSPLFNSAAYEIVNRVLDPEHVRRAWAALVRHSDALRTIIVDHRGAPQQRVLPDVSWALNTFDFSAEPDPEASLALWANERSQISLNLERCLFDVALIRLGPELYGIYSNVHHIVCDAWTSAIIAREFRKRYELSVAGRLHEAAPLPPFSEYVARANARERSLSAARAASYWRDTGRRTASVAFYGRQSEIQSTNVVRVWRVIKAERMRRLRSLAQQSADSGQRNAMHDLVGALVIAFLHHVTGSNTVTLGSPFHNRSGQENTIGLLMQILPIAVPVLAEDTVFSLATRIGTARLRAMRHRDWTVGNPLVGRSYDVEYNYIPSLVPRLASGHGARQVWLHSGHGLDPLAIQTYNRESDDDQHYVFDFHADVFDESCRGRAITDFEKVLDLVIDQPERRIHRDYANWL